MSTSYEAMQAQMTKAFNLVQPATHWKDPIAAIVPYEKLFSAGVTIEDIRQAVVHFTATTARITEHGGYIEVRAAGYRAGAAGGR